MATRAEQRRSSGPLWEISPAPSVTAMSPGSADRKARSQRGSVLRRSEPPDVPMRADALRQHLTRHLGNRRLTRAVDVGNQHHVGIVRRSLQTRRADRAFGYSDAAERPRPVDPESPCVCSGDRGANLGGMMSVVIDDHDLVAIANDAAFDGEASSDAAEAAHRLLEHRKRNAQKLRHRERCRAFWTLCARRASEPRRD